MSLKQLADLLTPKCRHCGKRHAKHIPQLGDGVFFCSMKCAALEGMSHAVWHRWCPFHGEWHHVDELSMCEEAKRLEGY